MLEYLLQAIKEERTVIFDLDNTLYNEKDFLFQKYHEISEALANNLALQKEYFKFLKVTFLKEGRKNLFDKFISRFSLSDNVKKDMLKVLRSPIKDCGIEHYDWFKKIILPKLNYINIITNGNVRQQKNKIECLFSKNYNLNIIYANEFEKKPSPESYFELTKILVVNRPIYIGDSSIDKEFSSNCNIEFIDVNML